MTFQARRTVKVLCGICGRELLADQAWVRCTDVRHAAVPRLQLETEYRRAGGGRFVVVTGPTIRVVPLDGERPVREVLDLTDPSSPS